MIDKRCTILKQTKLKLNILDFYFLILLYVFWAFNLLLGTLFFRLLIFYWVLCAVHFWGGIGLPYAALRPPAQLGGDPKKMNFAGWGRGARVNLL